MIDIIVEGKRFDVGMLFDIGGISTAIMNLVNRKSMDISSAWASLEKKMVSALEKLYAHE